MPWDNNTGGGGRSGGPWGQTPGGGGGGGGPRRPNGGGNTPNLEEILNRGRQQFGGGLPGGSRWIIIGVVLAVLAFWASQAVYTVSPQQVGVELLFGQPKDDLSEPGLHFAFWPVERVEVVDTTENQTRIGTGVGTNNEGLMLTGDQNIVNMNFSVLWRVGDPRNYLFNVREPDEMVRQVAESAMREVVGRRTAQDVFRDDRTGIAVEVQGITQNILESYGVGVNVSNISIENVAPPADVVDAFDEVQRALQDEDRFQEEARQYANTLLGNARGQAARIREDAAGYRDRVVNEAEGEASRFLAIYNQYAQAPEVTRKRIYLETMEEVLGGANKVLMEDSGTGVVPYLPLPELQNRAQSQPSSQSNSSSQTGVTSNE